MKIFIVIPAYNEEKRIGKVIEDLKKTKHPIIVVDDGSEDDTYKVSKKKKVQVFQHRINLGKGAAMKTGAEAAFKLGADAIVFMDSDGQHKAKDLKNFTNALNEGFEIVFGIRSKASEAPRVRFIGNRLASILISFLFGIYISDLLCGFRALTKKAYKKIVWESRGYAVETEMIIRTAKYKLRHCEVPVSTIYLDSVKGVTILDAINILFDVFRWRLRL